MRGFALPVPVGSVFDVVSGARCAIVLRVRSGLLLLLSDARTQLPLAVQLRLARPLRKLLSVWDPAVACCLTGFSLVVNSL